VDFAPQIYPREFEAGNREFRMKFALTLMLTLASFCCFSPASESGQSGLGDKTETRSGWRQLDRGLEFGTFAAPQAAAVGDSLVRVLRIDLNYYQLRLLNASQFKNGVPLTPKQWCRRNGLTAAINSSMYRTDFKTSVSLMRTKIHTNNPRLSKDMTILAFDRQRDDVPRAKIIDRECDDFHVWQQKYGTLVQSIRMISCTGKNVWKPQQRRWSTSAIGIDKEDRILFIHVRSPYSTHDLINMLQKLPLNILRAMYTEGGPQAQLHIKSGATEFAFTGSYDTHSAQSNEGAIAWPLPNVVGISKR